MLSKSTRGSFFTIVNSLGFLTLHCKMMYSIVPTIERQKSSIFSNDFFVCLSTNCHSGLKFKQFRRTFNLSVFFFHTIAHTHTLHTNSHSSTNNSNSTCLIKFVLHTVVSTATKTSQICPNTTTGWPNV